MEGRTRCLYPDSNITNCKSYEKYNKTERRTMERYISLGNDVAVLASDIVGIFDVERVSVTRAAAEYLNRCGKSGKVYYVSLEMPKSFVVTKGDVFVTNVSAATLKKRFNSFLTDGCE